MAREGTPSFASDRDLVLAFQQGKLGAYDEIYRLYSARIRRVCARMLKNPQDVDEATQETFLKAYQALGRFNGQYQLGAWLARIASNVCLDHIRSRSRTAASVALSDEHEAAGTERGPEDIVVGDDPRIQEVIAGIQPLHAQALKLRALGGLSHREMAGELQMTPAQVKALLHRARNSFRRAWDQAEGWALAPLAAARGFFSKESGANASSNLVGFTPTLSPLLAERVAASAVIVAVALSGVPTQPRVEAPPARRSSPVAVGLDDTLKPPAATTARPPARPSRAAVAEAPPVTSKAVAPPADDPVTKVLEAVGEHNTKLPEEKKGGDDEDDSDEGLSASGAASAAKPVVKKAKKLVQEITH